MPGGWQEAGQGYPWRNPCRDSWSRGRVGKASQGTVIWRNDNGRPWLSDGKMASHDSDVTGGGSRWPRVRGRAGNRRERHRDGRQKEGGTGSRGCEEDAGRRRSRSSDGCQALCVEKFPRNLKSNKSRNWNLGWETTPPSNTYNTLLKTVDGNSFADRFDR